MTTPMTLQELRQKFDHSQPDNEDRAAGWALVNVLPEEYFVKDHIPGSVNIPYEHLEEFEHKFEKSKELVVYCASVQCSAGPDTAKKLQARGFTNVRDFPGGTKEWRDHEGQENAAVM